jgi:uncharacterized protein YdhG (YjbR/CyaY superfamily)
MKTDNSTPGSIDEYIAAYPKDVRKILEELRTTIRKAVPEAEEKISYQMPAFAIKGILVYFAAFKNHIGFYPTSSGIKRFKTELEEYKSGKGSVQFPIDNPLPLSLITKIVRFRAEENLARDMQKRKIIK